MNLQEVGSKMKKKLTTVEFRGTKEQEAKLIEIIDAHKDDIPVKYVQIDDGWFTCWGDWGDFILFCVSLILHQANIDMFSWLWQGKRTSGNSSTFQVLACVTLVNIALAKAGHKARPRIGVG